METTPEDQNKKVTWLGIYRTLMSVSAACIPFVLMGVMKIYGIVSNVETRLTVIEQKQIDHERRITENTSYINANAITEVNVHRDIRNEISELKDIWIKPLYQTK